MRSLLLGTVDFSRHCLETLIRTGWPPAAVASLGAEIASFHTDHVDLRSIAEAQGIRGFRLGEDVDSLEALIEEVRPDVVLVFGWPRIIDAHLLEIPEFGFIGTHPALLPRNRGRHPIVWTLVDGDSEGGLTFFKIDQRIDSGPIIWQESFPIEPTDHAGDVYAKLEGVATRAIPVLMQALLDGTVTACPQTEAQATYRRKRGKKDGEVDWSGKAATAYNLIRALAKPYVGAHTYLNGKTIKLWHAECPVPFVDSEDLLPGTLLHVDNSVIVVAAADGSIRVSEFEAPTGLPLQEGQRLG